MKRWLPLASCFAILMTALAPLNTVRAGGTIVAPPQRKLLELVRSLGAADFQVREQASQELFRIGLPAKPVLLAGANDPDLEVRRRCRELLPEILEADRQARLAAFIADGEGKQQHALPGWERYRKIAGEDAAARRLFVEIQKSDSGFLRDVERDLDHAGELCAVQCQELFHRQFTNRAGINQGVNPAIALAEVAPLILVAADPRVRVPEQQRYLLFSILQYHPTSRNTLHNRDASPFKKIVLAWIERQTDDETALHQVFYLLNNLEIREGLDFTLRTIRDRKLKGMLLATALTTVGKLGDQQQLAVLEPFLSDSTMIGNFNLGTARGTTQVRDAALAMLVRLTKQSARDYGFAVSQLNNEHLMAYANFLGFSSDEQRTKALGKWKEWKSAQKK